MSINHPWWVLVESGAGRKHLAVRTKSLATWTHIRTAPTHATVLDASLLFIEVYEGERPMTKDNHLLGISDQVLCSKEGTMKRPERWRLYWRFRGTFSGWLGLIVLG